MIRSPRPGGASKALRRRVYQIASTKAPPLFQTSSHRARRTWRFQQRALRDRAWALAPPSASRAIHVAAQQRVVTRRRLGGRWSRLATKAHKGNERFGEGRQASVECSASRSSEALSKNQQPRLTPRSRHDQGGQSRGKVCKRNTLIFRYQCTMNWSPKRTWLTRGRRCVKNLRIMNWFNSRSTEASSGSIACWPVTRDS
jgi:hypothetical protein